MIEYSKSSITGSNVEYAKFWSRAGAYFIDGIIVSIFSSAFNYINIMNFKSFLLYLPIAILAILYKPYMESKYGATFGKMALNLKVTDHNFNQIGLKQSFLRSIFFIFPAIFYIPIYFLAFNNEALADLTGFMEFAQGMIIEYPIQTWISNISFAIILADIIVLLVNELKTQSSLHDQIAKTYVIQERN